MYYISTRSETYRKKENGLYTDMPNFISGRVIFFEGSTDQFNNLFYHGAPTLKGVGGCYRTCSENKQRIYKVCNDELTSVINYAEKWSGLSLNIIRRIYGNTYKFCICYKVSCKGFIPFYVLKTPTKWVFAENMRLYDNGGISLLGVLMDSCPEWAFGTHELDLHYSSILDGFRH